MGNKWSATPSFTSENPNDNDDGEPPDISNESTLTVTFQEAKNLKLENVLGGGKHHALIRVVSTFNKQQCYTKPLKHDNLSWHMPKRRFTFASNDPEGEIRISLEENYLPPLPAVPVGDVDMTNNHNSSLPDSIRPSNIRKKAVLAKMTIPVSFMELKQLKHIDRWYTIETPEKQNQPNLPGEIPQVRITLDFNYRPSRVVDSLDSLNLKYDIEDTIGTGVSVVKKSS